MNGHLAGLAIVAALTCISLPDTAWSMKGGTSAALQAAGPAVASIIDGIMAMKMQKMMMKMNKKMMKMQMTTPRPMTLPTYNVTMPKMKKKKKKKKNNNMNNNQPMMKGCFMKRRIIKVTVPKYKYYNVPYGKAVNPINMQAVNFKKGYNLGSVIQQPISSYSSGGDDSYGGGGSSYS